MYGHIERSLRRLVLFIILLNLGGTAWAMELSKHKVQINGIVIDVRGEEPVVPDILRPKVDRGPRKWMVQFAGPIREEEKTRVEKLGCRLHDYLPDFAFLATMDDKVKNAVAKLPFIEGVSRFKPAYKLQQRLRERATAQPSGETTRVHLKLDEPGNLAGLLAAVQRLKGKVLDVGRDSIRVEIDTTAVAEVAALEEVTWIDEHFDMQLFNDTTRWVIQTDIPGDTGIWDQGIRGEGQIVGVGDSGLDYDMPWFSDPAVVSIGPGHRKVVGYDTSYGDDYDAGNPGHGTHVSGTLAGDRTPVDGLDSGNGMAPKARIFLQDLTSGAGSYVFPPDDLGLMFNTAYNGGARFHTNSWGNGDRSYSSIAASADRFLWEHRDFLALFAAGNSGPASSTVGNPATAKNVISVGASYNGSGAEQMTSFSSNGPTVDGRIKPTVTAPGYNIVSADSDGLKDSFNGGTITMSGTSMATPAVAGAAALVRQYFTGGFHPLGTPSPGNAFLPSAALVKAVILNSAQDMSGSGTDGPIPATGQGWGRIDLAQALHFGKDSGSLAVEDEGAGLVTGANWSSQFLVPGGQPLKVTLVWTDYPGAPGAEKALVNDLDLAVTAPDGTVLMGNAFANGASFSGGTPDRLNVEEQVLIKVPAAGLYTVSVAGYNVPYSPQPFALAVTGIAGVTSKGTIALDRQRYNSSSTLKVRVADRDLDSDPASAQQIHLQVTSSSEPSGETITLTETAPNSAIFSGGLPLAAAPAVADDGRLQGANGDAITAIYQDANDGSGKAATATATAVVDNIPPVFSAFAVAGITDTAATIVWTTDKPANASLDYGFTPAKGGSISDQRLTTQHLLVLQGLQEAATYYLTANSTDEAGNTASSSSSFATLRLPPSLSVASSEGSATYQSATVIYGISSDPSGVASVAVNGTPANYRTSDGYYNLTEQLQIGDNSFTVAASDFLGNTASSQIAVTRLQPPDLIIQAVAGPQAAVQNGTITVTDTVCNNGPGAAASFLVGFYLSSDQSFSSDDWFIGSRGVPSYLGAGMCSSGTTLVSIPATAPGGPRYLIAYADYSNALPETNKNNNTLAGNQITLPNPMLAAPVSIAVPSSNTTGSVPVSWRSDNISGVTYVLEYSKDGGAWTFAYSGTTAYANFAATANGSYSFRVKATKTGYADSVYTTSSNSCAVALSCAAPVSISVPSSSTALRFLVSWSSSVVSGVTYVLEYSRDGGAWTSAYSGIASHAYFTPAVGGSYSFRVKATKTGYADSAYTTSANSCAVTLGAPQSIVVPLSNLTGRIPVSWSGNSISGVTYVLEYRRDGGAWTFAYGGTTAYANFTVTANGSYSFRVKATKTGYADSAYTTSANGCAVTLSCAAPTSISVPSSSTTGKVLVSWSSSNVSGVTYVLEYRRDGGTWTSAYSGTLSYVYFTPPVGGSYGFRVKATKTGYADSAYTTSANSCSVTLGAPQTIAVPLSNTAGSILVTWSRSTMSGVIYVLEYSKDGGAWILAYSGTASSLYFPPPATGSYSFRVKSTRTGFADSAYTTSKNSCVVTRN